MKVNKKIKYLLGLMYKVSPSFIFLTIFGSLFSAVQIIGNVVLPKFLIDELIVKSDLNKALFIGLIIVLFNLVINFINKTYKRLLEVKQKYVSYKIMQEMSNKITKVEYQYLEDPYYLDLKERAVFAAYNQGSLTRLIQGISIVITNALTLIGLTAVMITLGYVLVTILFVGIIISVIINALFMKYQANFFQSIIPINRKYTYYFGLSMNQKLAKDLRLYDMSPIILNRVQHYNQINLNNFTKYFKKQGAVLGLQKTLIAIQTGLVYLYVAWRATFDTLRKISIGDFTMYANAAINFTTTFDSLFFRIIDIVQVLDYLDPFVEFMQLEDAETARTDIVLNKIETIEFKNVSFTYPKTNQQILNNVSFKINKGEKISIVGLNGAGKTTIIKLLCRFYKPDSGQILVNGMDIFEIDYLSYLNQMAIVFQDFKIFAFSIKENIAPGNDTDLDKIKNILDQVSMSDRIKELPNGLDTKLNKEFDEDGIEFSGGQAQKIAIARALYKNASLVILDEPTSALDPIAEAEIYQNFNDLVLDKTAIYISHRMSSSVFCDYILVLEKGEVVAFDSHKNLMKDTNSLYYKLFTTQQENYLLD